MVVLAQQDVLMNIEIVSRIITTTTKGEKLNKNTHLEEVTNASWEALCLFTRKYPLRKRPDLMPASSTSGVK